MTIVNYVVVLILVYDVISANKRLLKTESYQPYKNMVEMSGTIKKTTTASLIGCVRECTSDDKCLTFFFNTNHNKCVMHSKHFYYQSPSMVENGWKYFITKDVTGRCPTTHLYYRNLGLCYTFDEIAYIDIIQINAQCSQKGAQLAAVKSQLKYDYLVHILANRTYVRVIIQGTRVNAFEWMLDDRTPLTYFNWFPLQPDNALDEDCLELKDDDKYQDIQCFWPFPAVFICELHV